MILLDTQIWVWWIEGSIQLRPRQKQLLLTHHAQGLAISVLSCWEIAQKSTAGKVNLSLPLNDWMAVATASIDVIDLNMAIAMEANQLPSSFHRDPADQIIVATARQLNLPLLTADAKILNYPHVTLLT